MTDPIADLLTRIRNAYAAHHEEVTIPYSKVKLEVVRVLKDAGYLESSDLSNENGHQVIKLSLKYIGKTPAISKLERISTPGRRVYSTSKSVKPVLAGNGIKIISTNRGVMVDSEARAQNLGGEIICKVW